MRLACSIGVIGVAILCAGCSRSTTPQRYTTSAPLDAPELMIQYGCPTCHVVPRVPGAVGKVGPSLEGLDQPLLSRGIASEFAGESHPLDPTPAANPPRYDYA